jgi:mono/diheme cytochrome c family protein
VSVARIKIVALLAVASLTACVSPAPTSSGDDLSAASASGRAFAEQTCASCHAIENEAAISPHPAATPFEAVANTPGMTAIALNAWLHSAHPSMPNVAATHDQTDDLWAYLMTLRDQR